MTEWVIPASLFPLLIHMEVSTCHKFKYIRYKTHKGHQCAQHTLKKKFCITAAFHCTLNRHFTALLHFYLMLWESISKTLCMSNKTVVIRVCPTKTMTQNWRNLAAYRKTQTRKSNISVERHSTHSTVLLLNNKKHIRTLKNCHYRTCSE